VIAARRTGWPWASFHLAFGLVGVVLIAVAQLYAFTEMSVYATTRIGGSRATLLILFGASFFIFTTVALVRIAPMMLFAYFDATRAVPSTPRRFPPVSILIPAHDEAERSARCRRSSPSTTPRWRPSSSTTDRATTRSRAPRASPTRMAVDA
jgi:hypothetical protein